MNLHNHADAKPGGLCPPSGRVIGVLLLAMAGFCFLFTSSTNAAVPALLSYQGRIAVGTTTFDGTGQFKLALVNSGASLVYWRNAGDSNSDGEPDQAVSVAVAKGL